MKVILVIDWVYLNNTNFERELNKLELANEWQILIAVKVRPNGTLRRNQADTIEESVVLTVGLS